MTKTHLIVAVTIFFSKKMPTFNRRQFVKRKNGTFIVTAIIHAQKFHGRIFLLSTMWSRHEEQLAVGSSYNNRSKVM
jgi:hypothetical protein